MDLSSIWFIVLNVLSIAALFWCFSILICNYKKRHQLSSEQKIWQNSLMGGIIVFVIFTYLTFCWVTTIKDRIDLLLRVIPIIMGAIAFVIAFLNFKRKDDLSFNFTINKIGGWTWSDHRQIRKFPLEIILYNNKDKMVVVSNIYLVLNKFVIVNLEDLMGDEYIDKNIIFNAYEAKKIIIERPGIIYFYDENKTLCTLDVTNLFSFDNDFPRDFQVHLNIFGKTIIAKMSSHEQSIKYNGKDFVYVSNDAEVMRSVLSDSKQHVILNNKGKFEYLSQTHNNS